MKHSESIVNISKAIFEFQKKAVKIIKRAENPFFKSKYADLPSILDEIHTPLIESGLVISQWPDGEGLTTLVVHPESGEYMMANAIMHPVKADPQSIGSAITFQRRYSLCSILGLNVDEDDDGNKASAPAPQRKWLNITIGSEQFNRTVAEFKRNGWVNIDKEYQLKPELRKAIQEAAK
jgi:hypothetical protein